MNAALSLVAHNQIKSNIYSHLFKDCLTAQDTANYT